MIRLVLDTNVVLDLLHFRDPGVESLREALREGRAACIGNSACRDELAHVLSYPQFKIPEHEARRILDEYCALAPPCAAGNAGLPPLPQCRDPDDQKFLEVAHCGAAVALLTYDRALLKLRRRLAFPVVTPEQWHAGQT